MSMILDALQRADRERQKQEQPPPSLSTPTTPPPRQAPASKRAWWLAGAALALALVAALLFVALNRPPAAPASQTPARAVQPQEPAPTPEPAPRPSPEPRTDATPAKPEGIAELYQSPQVEETSVTQLYRRAQSGGSTTPSVDAAKAAGVEGAEGHTQQLGERPDPAAVRLTEVESATNVASEAGTAQTPAPKATPQEPEASSEPSPESSPKPAPDSTSAVTSVRDLPWNLQQTMPSLNYQRHDYRNGDASRVVINGKELRAGQQVASDLKLERIEEDGAIMRYQGHRFKLRALNSWVNM